MSLSRWPGTGAALRTNGGTGGRRDDPAAGQRAADPPTTPSAERECVAAQRVCERVERADHAAAQ
ncbi:hypothetical protein ACINK0_18965 (plasmid) [Deinococcus sp. VB343]|uniref:hypothetical protein n=1 Tax=Deinococcus sp. VB343 TaxID=3385567 RepID=UPI0039C93F52